MSFHFSQNAQGVLPSTFPPLVNPNGPRTNYTLSPPLPPFLFPSHAEAAARVLTPKSVSPLSVDSQAVLSRIAQSGAAYFLIQTNPYWFGLSKPPRTLPRELFISSSFFPSPFCFSDPLPSFASCAGFAPREQTPFFHSFYSFPPLFTASPSMLSGRPPFHLFLCSLIRLPF